MLRHIVVLDGGDVMFTGLRAASSGAPDNRLGGRRAALLFSTSTIVGDERAIDAAQAGLGDEQLAATVPFLQPAVVPREDRKGIKGVKKSSRRSAPRSPPRPGSRSPRSSSCVACRGVRL